jgi:hypothetical protein
MAALFEKLLEVLLAAVMSPTVLPLARAAVRAVMSDELENAPRRGMADDEFEQKVVESVPLPGHHPDA